ncbi:hypothetical protein [Streptomyces sp. NPDC047315]|uniref:hypothetical protein n=1 Tax=Streptomyces sp. NPDC047315 TaxID=3155142 RepID=UPI0033C499A6
MSEEPGGKGPQGGGGDKAGGGGGGGGAGQGAGSDDGLRHGAVRSGPLGEQAGIGAQDAVRHARANFVDVHGRNAILDGTQGDVHLGDHHHYHRDRTGLPRLVSGALPRDELRRLRLVFEEPPRYAGLLDLLKQQRLVALCGDPGSGRRYAALSLLDAVTRGRVERLDPRTDLDTIAQADLQEGHGYLVEISGEEAFAHDRHRPEDERDGERGGERRWLPERPAELHLDRLSAILDRRRAYGILVVASGGFADELLRGRYGRLFLTASADGVLRKHLVALLGHADGEGLERASQLARSEDVVEALGLDGLRPHEVESLAGLLVGHLKGETSADELVAELRTFAPRQARAWFASTSRAGPRNKSAVTAALRQAAFRTAVAVYNGSPYSVAATAADRLAWEFALAAFPDREPGRALFGDHQEARLAATRAELFDGEIVFDGRKLRTRNVRLQGRALARAVLSHVWDDYQSVRDPLCQWLRTQCADEAPMVWVPAAITAGALCTLDYAFAFDAIVDPMASADSLQQRVAAATVLAQAATLNDAVRPIVRDFVRAWARGDDRARQGTAALVHGFGTVATSVSASLDELGRLAGEDDTELRMQVSFSVARLLAGTQPEVVLRRMGAWLGDRRQDRRDLALATVDRALWNRPRELWGFHDRPGMREYPGWPLAAALLTLEPRHTRMLADLVWCGLDTARWREELQISLSEWMRRGEREPALLDALCDFLPHLVSGTEDTDRLRNLLRRMERDPDEPLKPATVRQLRAAVEG